jgi:hypothetical protein
MSRRLTRRSPGQYVTRNFSGAALTTLPISPEFAVTSESRALFDATVYTGRDTIAGTTEIQWQQSNGDGIWFALGSALALTSSTNLTASVPAGSSDITVTAHGLTNGRVVVVAATTTLPPEFQPNTKYVVRVVDANTIRLLPLGSEAYVVASVASSGMTVTAVRGTRLSLNYADSTDASLLPTANLVRATLTKANADTVQVVDVRVTM